MSVEPSPDTEHEPAAEKPWVSDLLASVVVFLVALPLCIGIAVACGVPAERGLLTGILGGIVVGRLAGSPLLVSGPAASLIVPVFDLVRAHGLSALAPVVMLAGLWQGIAGLLRLGQWFRAVAPAVIQGMLIGIGFLICASQLHVAIDADPRASFFENIVQFPGALTQQLSSGSAAPVLLSVATIGILVGWNTFRPRFLSLVPGHLVALVAVTVATILLRPNVRFLDISPRFFEGLAPIEMADLRVLAQPSIFGLSLMFAFIASAATLFTASAIDQRQTRTRTDYDREILAQGVGNMLAGSVGGLPMTGVIVRSSVNVDAGAQTRLSAILHGVWILLFVVVAPEALERIPKACLGAILVYTGYRLIDRKGLAALFRQGWPELAIALLTLFGVVFIELFVGILIGLAAAFGKLVYTFSRLEIRSHRDSRDNVWHLHLTGSATFLQLPRLARALDDVPLDRELHVHIDRLDHIDHACLELLSGWKRRRESSGAPGMVVEWNELAERYRKAAFGGRAGDAQQSDSLLRLIWGEWKRLHGAHEEPQSEARRQWQGWIDASRIRVAVVAHDIGEVIEHAAEMLAPVAERPEKELARVLSERVEGHVALGDGVSIPHAPVPDLDRPIGALVVARAPIELAGESVDVFFVLLAPESQPREHLRALANVARLCRDRTLLAKLRRAKNGHEAAALLRDAEASLEIPRQNSSPTQLAVLEIEDSVGAKRLEGLLGRTFGRPRLLSGKNEVETFEVIRKAVDASASSSLLLVAMPARDEQVLRALLDQHEDSFPGLRLRMHVLRLRDDFDDGTSTTRDGGDETAPRARR